MSWGYKILFVYIAFVGLILFLVLKASFQKDDLVTKDYYAQELKYQERIDEKQRTNALSAELRYAFKEGKLHITFPKDFSGQTIIGNVLLYCPSDEQKDMKQHFTLQGNLLTLDIPANYEGLFELHISWLWDGKQYYYEEKLFL